MTLTLFNKLSDSFVNNYYFYSSHLVCYLTEVRNSDSIIVLTGKTGNKCKPLVLGFNKCWFCWTAMRRGSIILKKTIFSHTGLYVFLRVLDSALTVCRAGVSCENYFDFLFCYSFVTCTAWICNDYVVPWNVHKWVLSCSINPSLWWLDPWIEALVISKQVLVDKHQNMLWQASH